MDTPKVFSAAPENNSNGPIWVRRPEGSLQGAPVMVPVAMLALRSACRRI
jgi:hypothetical protein